MDLGRKQPCTALDPSLGKSSYGFMVPVKLSPAPARGGLSSKSSGGGGGGSSGGERRKRSRERGSERGSGRRGAENEARSSTHGRERSQTEPSERRVKREKRDDGYEAGEGPVQGAGRPEVPRVCGLWVWRPSAPGRGILWLFRQHFLKGLPMAIWD